MAGLERPDKGEVEIDGVKLGGLNEDALARFRGQRIGIVFQSFHLIPTMTALENVAAPLELAGATDASERARAELEQVGLGDRLSHYPAQLSGGEQQRVALARALCPRPSLLIADEPTGNLDETTGRAIIDMMFDRASAARSDAGARHARRDARGALRPRDPHALGQDRGAVRRSPFPHERTPRIASRLAGARRPCASPCATCAADWRACASFSSALRLASRRSSGWKASPARSTTAWVAKGA